MAHTCWNGFHLGRVENHHLANSFIRLPFPHCFFREKLCFFISSDDRYLSVDGEWMKPMFELKLRFSYKFQISVCFMSSLPCFRFRLICFLCLMQHKTIDSVLERGEKLDSLVEKSSDLSAASQVSVNN